MRHTPRHTTKSANYQTIKFRRIKPLFIMLNLESQTRFSQISTTKIAKPLKTLTGKLVMLSKRRNSPPIPTMATMANLPAYIIGAITSTNIRSSQSTIIPAITTTIFNLQIDLEIILKVKELA